MILKKIIVFFLLFVIVGCNGVKDVPEKNHHSLDCIKNASPDSWCGFDFDTMCLECAEIMLGLVKMRVNESEGMIFIGELEEDPQLVAEWTILRDYFMNCKEQLEKRIEQLLSE